MNNETIQEKVRKELMFITKEDHYFLTYNLIFLLLGLDCISQKKPFKDIKKITYLVDFIADYYFLSLLENIYTLNLKVTDIEKNIFSRIYSRGQNRTIFFMKIIYALEKKQFITLESDNGSLGINAWLNLHMLPSSFLDADIFLAEKQNIKILKILFPRIRTLSLSSLQNKVFQKCGVLTWQD